MFAVALLVPWLSLPLAAQSLWSEHKNLESDPARPLGWSFEVPRDWQQAPLARFPYPLGEGWSGPEGHFQVCWLGQRGDLAQEQLGLESRGFLRQVARAAGREALIYRRQDQAYCYINSPKGACRLSFKGETPLQEHILRSFTLLETVKSSQLTEQVYQGWAFSLPGEWRWQAPNQLWSGDQAVVKLAHYPLDPKVMLRGWARSQASQENPLLKLRLELEPFRSRHGLNGYLVEWQGSDPQQNHLFAYLSQAGQGLRLELLQSAQLDNFRRLLNSLRIAQSFPPPPPG